MASMIDFDMENKRLKAQIQELSDELKEKDNQIILSAQLGKELLESNSELNRQMEEIQDSNLMQIEELRQENYSLKMKIESNVRVKENIINEMENMREKLQENANQELSRVKTNHDKKISELQLEIESLQAEINKRTLVMEQLQEKVSKQEEMLAEAHKYSKQLQGMGILETKLEELKEECTLMKFKNDELKIMMADVNDEKDQLLFDQQNLIQKLDILKENLEEKTTQGKTWFDALQDSRQQISELQLEVSTLKAEALNRSHKEKGNSLFGEVEDKRLALEQKYSAISIKYESLQKTHRVLKRQLHQLKTQILPMLQMAGNQADSSKIKRLEAALSQSRSENQGLYVKIKDLEKANEERGLSTRLAEFHEAFTDFKDKKDYVTFLQNEIKCLKETNSDLKSKGEVTTVKLLAETDKRRETESLLHTSEVKKEKLEHEIVRLRLKLDELKMKLQQDGESTERMQESTNTRENGRSIWNDVSLFMTAGKRPEIAKNTVSGKLSSVRRAENKVHAPQHPVETKYIQKNQLNAAESAESLSSKKVKPVGRVIPINGQNLVDIEGRKTCNEKGVKSLIREESRNNRGSRAAPPTGSNNTSVPMEQLTTDTDSDIIDQTKPRDENHDPNNQGCMENRSTKGESDRKARRCEPLQGRVIHVKKDAGSQNECQQQ